MHLSQVLEQQLRMCINKRLCCGEDVFETGKKWMERVINFAVGGVDIRLL